MSVGKCHENFQKSIEGKKIKKKNYFTKFEIWVEFSHKHNFKSVSPGGLYHINNSEF